MLQPQEPPLPIRRGVGRRLRTQRSPRRAVSQQVRRAQVTSIPWRGHCRATLPSTVQRCAECHRPAPLTRASPARPQPHPPRQCTAQHVRLTSPRATRAVEASTRPASKRTRPEMTSRMRPCSQGPRATTPCLESGGSCLRSGGSARYHWQGTPRTSAKSRRRTKRPSRAAQQRAVCPAHRGARTVSTATWPVAPFRCQPPNGRPYQPWSSGSPWRRCG